MENKTKPESGSLPASEVFNLSKLVTYQEGAVVSRTLAKKEKGTLTLFAFAQGQALSEHSAPFDAIVQVVEGEGEVIIDGQVMKMSAGEMVLMPANIPHAVKAPKPFKMLLTMIRE